VKKITQNNKTNIYYFSGTGNSLHMAKCLKEKLDESELIPLAGLVKQNSIKATSEKVGFIFPVYNYGIPNVVHNFVEKIDLSNTKYIFTLATAGGPGKQLIIQQMNELLKPKNKQLDAAFIIKIFSAYIITSYDVLHPKEKRERRIKKAELKLDEIAEMIRNNTQGRRTKRTILPNMRGSYKSNMEKIHAEDENYYSDDKCNGCGICEKLCPVDNIKLVNEKPEWQHKCEQCLRCLHYCPQEAIQYGEHTLDRERYNHPNIKLKEFLNEKQV